MPAETQTKGRIKDARGRWVRQLDPVALHIMHQYSVVDPDALERIVDELEPGTAKRRRRLILIVPCVIAAFAVGIVALYYFSDASARRDLISTLTNPAIMVPSFVCCFLVPWITARQKRFQHIRFAMLKHRRCPHCGYDLRGLPIDGSDKATVCPECGCAWQLDDPAIADQATVPAMQEAPSASVRPALVILAVLLLVAFVAGIVMVLRLTPGPTPWLIISLGVGVIVVVFVGLFAHRMAR